MVREELESRSREAAGRGNSPEAPPKQSAAKKGKSVPSQFSWATASQLKRGAFLYVRQSTPRQVLEHTESTARQYALRKRAVTLGWRMT